MSVVLIFLIFSTIGTLRARQPDIDINRVRLLPTEEYHSRPTNYQNRRSIISDHRRNDYDHHSRRFSKLRAPVHVLDDTPPITEAKTGKTYQPREDPRLFYQSDAYIEEVNRKNMNNEVSSIYMERGVVSASDDNRRSLPIRRRDNELGFLREELCVQCPRDRTLIAKAGLDRAVLQYPRILTCSGRRVPRGVRFTRMYGPDFGTLLTEGSHMLVGQITHEDDILQTCKMQIHVLLQSCPVPKYLLSQCDSKNKTCTFTCREPTAELRGNKMLTCSDDLRWSGRLPVCNAHTWCLPPPPPEHGQLSCKGVTMANGRLAEGSSCRVKCVRGWRWATRATAVCRRGYWTHGLTCQPKRST